MSRRISFFVCGAVFFLVFVFLSYLVHKDFFTQFDFDMTVRLQDNISRRFDTVFSVFSDVGKFEIMLVVLVLIFAVVRKIFAGLAAIILFAGFHLFEIFGKFYITHAPPPQFLLRTESILDFPQFHIRADNSYPSGHAGRTMFLSAILLVLIWQAKGVNKSSKLFLSTVIVGFDIIMLVSRVYLGEHWTTDVIGGSVLGIGLGLMVVIFLTGRSKVKGYSK